MGELHLEIYVQKLKEKEIAVNTGRPQVAYRETIATACEFKYTLNKQTGGPGMHAGVIGIIEPCDDTL